MLKHLLVIVLLSHISKGEEITENVSKLCTELCSCVENKDVFYLNCTDAGLRHVLADWPTKNKTIKATFSHNKLNDLEFQPPSDAELELVFSYCSIKSLGNAIFKAIPLLKFLDLSHNEITSEELGSQTFKGTINPNDPALFEPLAIEHLDLSYNQIHTLSKNIFEHLVNLTELNLEGNNFQVLDHPTQLAIDGLEKLRKLNLARNELTELIPMAIEGLPTLIELNLAGNDLDFVPTCLANLSASLEILDLSDNPIFKLLDDSFLGLNNLRALKLNSMQRLRIILPNTFAPLTNLQTLELTNNPSLFHLDGQVFDEHPVNLRSIYLNNNAFTDLEVKLLQWSQLRVVEFSGNPLKCSCNLFDIKEQLSDEVKQELNGPRCMDRRVQKSRAVFQLTEDLCNQDNDYLSMDSVDLNFSTLKLALIGVCVAFLTGCIVLAGLICLKYRRNWRDNQYPFTTEVRYNPVNLNQALH